MKMKIKKGDFVKVISGKYKGTVGLVLKSLPREHRIIVENVNPVERYIKKKFRRDPNVTSIKKNFPIDVSNVVFFDNKNKKTCKIGYKIFGNEKWRVDKKTGEKIDIIKKIKRLDNNDNKK